MKPIRIISPNFDLLSEIDDYESLQFTKRWYKPGEFELHININKNNTETLQKDNIILLGSDIHKVGIIRHREMKLDENGKASEELLIKGTTLNGITNRRITVPPVGAAYDRIKDNAESIMKHYVDINCVNTTDIKRKIPQLIIAPDLKRGIYTPWQTRYEQLDLVIPEIAEWCDIGWDIYLDIVNKKWIFDVLEGKDLTTEQETLPPVIFSAEFDSIKGQLYVDSDLNYRNVGYAGGQGDEEQRLIQQIGDGEGLDRLETFLDCSDSIDITELTSNGQQKLAELKRIQSFEVDITQSSFIYGQDYDLGDKVTIQSKRWGVTMDSRITEITEVYEPSSGFDLRATFGNNIPTLVEKLKKETKKIVR